ncbi:helix-turn-helix domain-containing protein [Paenibacillus paridis]|uniref:helix-turn-helix domain-containing protein n=1 Tax=Paenibacillus paridis TaxID=2583376 RepID=UPI0013916379|nr:AraC family transcriptional regulator [Paenibacillus paridis]
MHELARANIYPVKETLGNEEAIRRVIRHIDLHYHEELKRDVLAQMAGFSPEYFSALFKSISGCSLTDYVTALRIRHIKERLLFAGTRLGDVAREVGYKDEYYVSRRFKHEVGVSPTQYVQSPKRIVSLNPHLTMHLLALGVVPAATASYPWGFGEYETMLQAAGCECRDWTIDYTQPELAELRPELIIGIDNLENARLRDCRQLAPTLVVPWYISDWKGHFRMLAQVCRRTEREREWLARFQDQISALRRQITASDLARQTATIVNIRDEAAFLYLNRGMGSQVVYDELKLAPPPEVRAAITNQASVPINLGDILPRYEADHMFIIVPPSPAAQARAEDLLDSELWQSYLARGGRVHRADMRRWHGYDPLSIQWQMTDIMKWFS